MTDETKKYLVGKDEALNALGRALAEASEIIAEKDADFIEYKDTIKRMLTLYADHPAIKDSSFETIPLGFDYERERDQHAKPINYQAAFGEDGNISVRRQVGEKKDIWIAGDEAYHQIPKWGITLTSLADILSKNLTAAARHGTK